MIVSKNFDSVYSAVNARLKTSNIKQLVDLILNSLRIKFSQSDNNILDNRDTKESIVDFVCALKRKKKHQFCRYSPYYFGSISTFC